MTRTLAILMLSLLAAGALRAEPLPPGDCAGVYWDLTALFETGDRIHARVLLTRAGPGERIAAGQGHWIDPDGAQTPFQNGRSAGHFTSEAGGRRLRIGSTELDLASTTHRFAVDNDRRGVKLSVEIAAAHAVDTSAQQGELAIDVVHLASPARASVWRRGMPAARTLRGRATLVRTRHAACERNLSALRVDLHRLADEGASLLIHERLASGSARSWFGWRNTAGELRTLRPRGLALEDWRRDAHGERLPRRLRSKGHGPGGEVRFGDSHLALDPLDALPRLVRMLYWFGASPRRIWADATSELVFEGDPVAGGPPSRGPALASFTFLRPPG